MLKVLLTVLVSVFAIAFIVGSAHAALLRFECTDFKKNGEPCEKKLTLSDGKGNTTACTACGTKYTFDGVKVVDEYGRFVHTH